MCCVSHTQLASEPLHIKNSVLRLWLSCIVLNASVNKVTWADKITLLSIWAPRGISNWLLAGRTWAFFVYSVLLLITEGLPVSKGSHSCPKWVYVLDFMRASELCTVFSSRRKHGGFFHIWGLSCSKYLSPPRSCRRGSRNRNAEAKDFWTGLLKCRGK